MTEQDIIVDKDAGVMISGGDFLTRVRYFAPDEEVPTGSVMVYVYRKLPDGSLQSLNVHAHSDTAYFR